MNILVTDANYKHTLGIVRYLGLSNFNPYVLSFKKGSLSASSKYCAGEIVLVNYSHQGFLRQLQDALKEYKIDLVIPVGANSFKTFSNFREQIKAITKIELVDHEKLNLCFSKEMTYRLAEQLGVPFPKSFYPKDIEYIDNIKHSISYPIVIKAINEERGKNVFYVLNSDCLMNSAKLMLKKSNLRINDILIQEYIDGYGCGFFAVYDNGVCGQIFMHKRIREMPPSGGASVAAESFYNDQLLAYGKKILDALHWHGVAMVEFKMTKNNGPVLIEINPKFWGSLDLALESGANFPIELVKISQGKEIKFSDYYQKDVRYHWPLEGDVLYAFLKPTRLIGVIKDFLDPKTKSNIWISDFMPTLVMIKLIWRYLFEKLTKKINGLICIKE